MNSNKATAAQASFCESLARQVGKDVFAGLYAKAARINSNAPFQAGETVTQAVRRLTRKAASSLIDSLIDYRDNPSVEVPEVVDVEVSDDGSEIVVTEKIDPVVEVTAACPSCGNAETTDANTHEAWCAECDWHIGEDEPVFAAFRAAVKARRAETLKQLRELFPDDPALGEEV